MMLSERLQAVCALCPHGKCLVDIGTDHGYVPVTLVEEGIVNRAVAMDVRKGPLSRAAASVREAGLSDRISLRLSDGLDGLQAGEADVVLIAGMGGPLTIRILAAGEEKLSGVKALVLQPQSEIGDVRRYLSMHGWRILRENMVLEDGKYYPMMEAERGQEPLSRLQLQYGPRLLEERHPVLLQYLRHEERTLLMVLKKLKELEKTSDEDRNLETESLQDAGKDGSRNKKDTGRAGAERRAARAAQVQMALELNNRAQGGDVR
jgi:tRNA (adenine22-N1)-methyltransferase